MRNQQGDAGLQHGSYQDASLAYRLALRIDPHDAHARAGLVEVQLRIAEQQYRAAKFEDALTSIAVAAKYDPQSVRLAELRSEIEQAASSARSSCRIIPPTRRPAASCSARTRNCRCQREDHRRLQRFSYSFDSAQLTQAIQNSYELGEELQKNTNRLIIFRQLVSPGARGRQRADRAGASLLPLP